jgi:hypothetical protein
VSEESGDKPLTAEFKQPIPSMILKRCSFLLAAAVIAATCAWSGSPESFIAASVKLSAKQQPMPGEGILGPPLPSGPIATLSLPHATLKGLLTRAYSLRVWQIAGPSWLEGTYYDVKAKVPAGARPQQVAEMLRNLLAHYLSLS